LLAAAAAAFAAVFVAELGDKTQLISLAMACRYPPLQVLAGAMVALAAALGLAAAAGSIMAAAFPHSLVSMISGLFFVAVGVYNFLRCDVAEKKHLVKGGFIQTLMLVFVAEFGDKTQLATLFLAASLGYPAAVFAGAMAAMFLNHLLVIYIGSRFLVHLNPRLLKIGTGFLFVIIGLIIIIQSQFALFL